MRLDHVRACDAHKNRRRHLLRPVTLLQYWCGPTFVVRGQGGGEDKDKCIDCGIVYNGVQKEKSPREKGKGKQRRERLVSSLVEACVDLVPVNQRLHPPSRVTRDEVPPESQPLECRAEGGACWRA